LLKIASQEYQIPSGTIVYLEFNDYRLNVSDVSIDRILCMDAFLHVVNQEELMSEFECVLVPGGLHIFSEPDPKLSATPQSQDQQKFC